MKGVRCVRKVGGCGVSLGWEIVGDELWGFEIMRCDG